MDSSCGSADVTTLVFISFKISRIKSPPPSLLPVEMVSEARLLKVGVASSAPSSSAGSLMESYKGSAAERRLKVDKEEEDEATLPVSDSLDGLPPAPAAAMPAEAASPLPAREGGGLGGGAVGRTGLEVAMLAGLLAFRSFATPPAEGAAAAGASFGCCSLASLKGFTL